MDRVKLFAATYGLVLSQIASSYVFANFVSPETYGAYLKSIFYAAYVPYMSFGMINGMSYYLVLERNKNRFYMTSVTITMVFIIAFISFLVLMFFNQVPHYKIITNISIAITILLSLFTSFFSAKGEYVGLYKLKFLQILSGTALLPLVFVNEDYIWLRYGIAGIFLTIFFSKYFFKFISFSGFDLRLFKIVTKRGFLPFIITLVYGFYLGVDRLFLKNSVSNEEFAEYGIAMTFASFARVLFEYVGQIFYRKIGDGIASQKRKNVLEVFLKNLVINSSIVVLVIIGMHYLLNFVLEKILPLYASIESLIFTVVIGHMIIAANNSSDMLFLLNQKRLYIFVNLLPIALFGFFLIIFAEYSDVWKVSYSLVVSALCTIIVGQLLVLRSIRLLNE